MPDGRTENDAADKARARLHERPEQPSLLKNLNERHAAVYAKRAQKLQEELNETTLKIALDQRQSEADRGIPIANWTFEGAINDATDAAAVVKAQQARNAGRSKKTDALQELIVEIVRDNPRISQSQLLLKLGAPKKPGGVIEDIDGPEEAKPSIHFVQNGRSKEAPISGLKDRLTRARKVIKSEIAETR